MSQRELSRADAVHLRSGDDHYMAYVGPPEQYDAMALTQLALLGAMGLRSNHNLLDLGCGSLRAGRLLIPYLDPGRYYGIEPNDWLVEDGIKHELGHSILDITQPHFAYRRDFDASLFGVRFDFVLAQSVLSHTGRALAVEALTKMRRVLAPNGIALVSLAERHWPRGKDCREGWVYPDVVVFDRGEVRSMARESGLSVARLHWHHPRLRWYVFVHGGCALPSWNGPPYTSPAAWLRSGLHGKESLVAG